jgi:hypothetical protein
VVERKPLEILREIYDGLQPGAELREYLLEHPETLREFSRKVDELIERQEQIDKLN